MYRLENGGRQYFDQTCFYLFHDANSHTLGVFGTYQMVRWLKLAGLPEVVAFEWQAECFDEQGASLGKRQYRSNRDEVFVFDSSRFFDLAQPVAPQRISGSVRLSALAAILESEPETLPAASQTALDGVFMVCRPGSFITGVHMYHSVLSRKPLFIAKHYCKAMIKAAVRGIRRLLLPGGANFWRGDAVGAVAVHSSGPAGGVGIAVMHNDMWYPGLSSLFEFRNETGDVKTQTVPGLRPGATFRSTVRTDSPRELARQGSWAQALCIEPPLNMGRFLAGEEFPDGSFTLDHAYYQQPTGSRWGKEKEARFFPKNLLDGRVFGPSNPWYCRHDEKVESLVGISNQFHPENEYRYDLLVFAQDGRLVLRKPEFCVLPPWGFAVPSVSAVLRDAGMDRFEGSYLLTYSASNRHDVLPSRIHVQGIYRFDGGYWNGVQSDSSIWSTPRTPVPGIEALSLAKVRRRQLWYATTAETPELETFLSLANLSYTLDYDFEQTLSLRYCRGGEVLAEKEITLAPFGSALVGVRELFGDVMTRLPQDGQEFGGVLIYPRTGKTYCASYLIRDKRSGRFFLEHVSPVHKLASER